MVVRVGSLFFFFFLVATKRLYKSVCPSVGPSVRPSVRMSVMLLLFGLLGATNAVYTALLLEGKDLFKKGLPTRWKENIVLYDITSNLDGGGRQAFQCRKPEVSLTSCS